MKHPNRKTVSRKVLNLGTLVVRSIIVKRKGGKDEQTSQQETYLKERYGESNRRTGSSCSNNKSENR